MSVANDEINEIVDSILTEDIHDGDALISNVFDRFSKEAIDHLKSAILSADKELCVTGSDRPKRKRVEDAFEKEQIVIYRKYEKETMITNSRREALGFLLGDCIKDMKGNKNKKFSFNAAKVAPSFERLIRASSYSYIIEACNTLSTVGSYLPGGFMTKITSIVNSRIDSDGATFLENKFDRDYRTMVKEIKMLTRTYRFRFSFEYETELDPGTQVNAMFNIISEFTLEVAEATSRLSVELLNGIKEKALGEQEFILETNLEEMSKTMNQGLCYWEKEALDYVISVFKRDVKIIVNECNSNSKDAGEIMAVYKEEIMEFAYSFIAENAAMELSAEDTIAFEGMIEQRRIFSMSTDSAFSIRFSRTVREAIWQELD